ncbi:MAG: redoxin domain-containing protein [Cyclobacteriaceae bacterium]
MIKRYFITAFIIGAVIAFAFALMAVLQQPSFTMIFQGVCALMVMLYFGTLYVFTIPRNRSGLPLWTILIYLTGIAALVFNKLETRDLLTNFPTLGIMAGWWLYAFWYSGLGKRSGLEKGKKLPHFQVEDIDGKVIKSSTFGKSVIMFYRGNWCPFCMAQIKELISDYKKLSEKGAKLIFISPQPAKKTIKLAKKFGVEAEFLIDREAEAAKTLNLFHENGTPIGLEVLGHDQDTVKPTVLVIDEKRSIVYSDLTENYRLRPKPSSYVQFF